MSIIIRRHVIGLIRSMIAYAMWRSQKKAAHISTTDIQGIVLASEPLNPISSQHRRNKTTKGGWYMNENIKAKFEETDSADFVNKLNEIIQSVPDFMPDYENIAKSRAPELLAIASKMLTPVQARPYGGAHAYKALHRFTPLPRPRDFTH